LLKNAQRIYRAPRDGPPGAEAERVAAGSRTPLADRSLWRGDRRVFGSHGVPPPSHRTGRNGVTNE